MTLRPPADQDIVIVGATGDLSARKLLPALYNLHAEGLLPQQGTIIGAAPVPWTPDQFRDHAHDAVAAFSRTGIDEATFRDFAQRLRFAPMDDSGSLAGVKQLASAPKRLAYLAVPPSAFTPVIAALGHGGLVDGTSVIIEKPFGHDLKSAQELNATLHEFFAEEQIFRIDHYLGKETVQNLLVFRFGNSLFERIWNRDAIGRIEITVAESIGMEHRGRFYDPVGAIRDIVQNHLFQVLSLVAMEAPISFDAQSIRNEKVKVLQAIAPLPPADLVRGQYTAGEIAGEPVPAYRQEDGVDPASQTETFAALRLHVDTWRWAGVPFLLRTGKRLPRRDTRVVITFRDAPLHLFSGTSVRHLDENRLVIRIQPDEGIALGLAAKRPGPEVEVKPVWMDFAYGESFKTKPPEAYERLLHDALTADHTLFIREDEVERGWAIVDGVLQSPPPLQLYAAGTWGPAAAAKISASGWQNPGED